MIAQSNLSGKPDDALLFSVYVGSILVSWHRTQPTEYAQQ